MDATAHEVGRGGAPAHAHRPVHLAVRHRLLTAGAIHRDGLLLVAHSKAHVVHRGSTTRRGRSEVRAVAQLGPAHREAAEHERRFPAL